MHYKEIKLSSTFMKNLIKNQNSANSSFLCYIKMFRKRMQLMMSTRQCPEARPETFLHNVF